MTLSLSPFVRSCFRVSLRLLFFLSVSLKFPLVLKRFNGVSRQFKECLNFNGSFKEVFLGSFKDVSRMFKVKSVSRKF